MEALIELADVLSVSWLRKKGLRLRVDDDVRCPLRYFFICKVLAEQLEAKERAKFISTHVPGILDRTIRRWTAAGWDPAKMYTRGYAKYVESLPAGEETDFDIEIIDRTEPAAVQYTIVANIKRICHYLSKPAAPKPHLKINEIVQAREKAITEFIEAPPIDDDDMDAFEQLVIKVCTSFAEGLISITEACDRHGLPYLRFVETLNRSEDCQKIYADANRVAFSLQNLRQLNMSDMALIEILNRRKHTEEVIHYDMVRTAADPKGRWMEVKRTVKTRDLTVTETAAIKTMLLRSSMNLLDKDRDRYSQMSEAELLREVMKDANIEDALPAGGE